ncbi:MAG: MazG-like family protein [Patescibacteria group bacterium]
MLDLKQLQAEVLENKKNKGFNTTDIPLEFCFLNNEVTEAFEAWLKKKDNLGEELADITIYLLGLAEIFNLDLEKELRNKMERNKNREYKIVDGVPIRTKEA